MVRVHHGHAQALFKKTYSQRRPSHLFLFGLLLWLTSFVLLRSPNGLANDGSFTSTERWAKTTQMSMSEANEAQHAHHLAMSTGGSTSLPAEQKTNYSLSPSSLFPHQSEPENSSVFLPFRTPPKASPGSFAGRKYCVSILVHITIHSSIHLPLPCLFLTVHWNHAEKFVHIGKTGGSVLSCELGYRYAPTCRNFKPIQNKSQLVAHRQTYAHMMNLPTDEPNNAITLSNNNITKGTENDVNTFLIACRNPIERLISWFHYEHPQQKFIQAGVNDNSRCSERLHNYKGNGGCFASFEEFAGNVTPPLSSSSSISKLPSMKTTISSSLNHNLTCSELAWYTAIGTIACAYHNRFNYAFYTERIPQISHKLANVDNNKEDNHDSDNHILVFNNNNLAKDWDTLEGLFGGNSFTSPPGESLFQAWRPNKSLGDKNLSPESLQKLCAALCAELQIYKRLILHAENMDDAERKETIGELLLWCPEETLLPRTCPGRKAWLIFGLPITAILSMSLPSCFLFLFCISSIVMRTLVKSSSLSQLMDLVTKRRFWAFSVVWQTFFVYIVFECSH